jgi:hypothetical protein
MELKQFLMIVTSLRCRLPLPLNPGRPTMALRTTLRANCSSCRPRLPSLTSLTAAPVLRCRI